MVREHSDALASEVGVLGSLLLSSELVGEALTKLEDSDFSDNRARLVWQAIRRLFAAGKPIDAMTVRDELGGSKGDGWSDYLLSCMDNTPTAVNVWEYVRRTRESARLRRLQALGLALVNSHSLDEALETMGKASAELVDRPGIQAVTMEQAMLKFFERNHSRKEYLPWPFEKLQDKLYIDKGDMVVLGGYSSAGKTALALQLAWFWASRGKKVGFFSLETGDEKLHDRIITHVMRLDFSAVKRHELTEADNEALCLAHKRLTGPELEYIPASRTSVDDIQAFSLSRGYEIIFIDYLQLVQGRGNRLYEQVTDVSKRLHQMSQSTGITVVPLSQLSRAEKSGGAQKAPTMSSLRESGQIEQDADLVMLLYKEEDTPNARRVLQIAKNKEGELGLVYLTFDGQHQTFQESVVDAPAPRRKPEPELKQVQMYELPPQQSDMPF